MGARVVYLRNDAWSVPPLEALAGDPGIEPVLVLTRTPRPGRRGAPPAPTPVAASARELDLPLLEVPTVVSGPGRSSLREADPDVVVVVAYGELLPRDALEAGRFGAVNLHLSLLPRWRGASPVQHALLAGDTETGVTTMLLDEGLDTGPVLAQAVVAIEAEDDAGRLGARLARLGGELLARTIVDLAAGRVTPRAQEDALATAAPKLTAEDRRLRWDRPAAELVGRVRAFAPRPGADTLRGDRILKILAAAPVAEEGAADPAEAAAGTVVRVDPTWFEVAAGEGRVRVLEVAAEGRARMPTGDWLRGSRLEPGERLG